MFGSEVLVLTKKGQCDESQAHVPQPNVHTGGHTTGSNAANVEPSRHERLFGVQGFGARARSVRIEGIVARSQRGYRKKDQRRKRELDNHVQTGGKQREREDVLGLAVSLVFLEHPLVVYRN